MPDAIPQHRHCPICGKAIPLEEEFCSEACRQKYQKLLKRRKQLLLLMYIALFAIVVIMFVIPKMVP
ncbi:MAG: DUF2116 family Zn-ribbon domain-containing protein [Thermoplasmata archaeon]|nr:DUF2116 family Zn-ribbon domain-containing protein [Thermoplasmata archaeon]